MVKEEAPKLFSKKWFENYWFYYKWHTIGAIFVLFLVITTVTECANRVNPDLTVSYVGSGYYDDAQQEELKAILADVIDDVNGDGKKSIVFSNITMSQDGKSEQDMMMQQKLMVELAAGETTLYLYDDQMYESLHSQQIFEEYEGQDALELKNFMGGAKKISVRVLRGNEAGKASIVAQQNNAKKAYDKLKELYQ